MGQVKSVKIFNDNVRENPIWETQVQKDSNTEMVLRERESEDVTWSE